jgi:hypothetical protein
MVASNGRPIIVGLLKFGAGLLPTGNIYAHNTCNSRINCSSFSVYNARWIVEMPLKPKGTPTYPEVLSHYKTLLTQRHQTDVRTTRYPGKDSQTGLR